MFFVFAALSEFVIVKFLDERYKVCKKREMAQLAVRNVRLWLKYGIKRIYFFIQETTTITPWCNNGQFQEKIKTKSLKLSHCGFFKLYWQNVNCYYVYTYTKMSFVKYLFFILQNKSEETILWCEIDRYSRIIFPILFLIFMVIYWPLLMFKSTVIF